MLVKIVGMKGQLDCFLDTEIKKESGFRDSSYLPCEDHERADEDVDIGGNDPPPISSSPPIWIDKDDAERNSNCSGSRSSSSESGTSSTGDLRSSLTNFEKVLEVLPENCDALKALGHIHVQLEQTEKAQELYRKATKIDPRDPQDRKLGINSMNWDGSLDG